MKLNIASKFGLVGGDMGYVLTGANAIDPATGEQKTIDYDDEKK